MDIFDNLGKIIGDATQTAAKKSSELINISKLSMELNGEEDKLKKLYLEIGKLYFEKYVKDETADPDFKAFLSAAETQAQTVKDLKEKILVLKNVKECINCGAEIERDVIICNKCGTIQNG